MKDRNLELPHDADCMLMLRRSTENPQFQEREWFLMFNGIAKKQQSLIRQIWGRFQKKHGLNYMVSEKLFEQDSSGNLAIRLEDFSHEKAREIYVLMKQVLGEIPRASVAPSAEHEKLPRRIRKAS